MRKVLVTGENSYVGNSFAEWVGQHQKEIEITKISLRNNEWKKKDFSGYDVVLHVAGIAHIKEKKNNKDIYYSVNRDLALDVAKKAKNEGVKQFIFISTMSVYGMYEGIITEHTKENPTNSYGMSKLEAEKQLILLKTIMFKVAIIRPPMIYGENCKGNYRLLSHISKKVLFFPKVDNKRSMIYVNHLSAFLFWIIQYEDEGLFYPQNDEYVNTFELVKLVANSQHKRIIGITIFNWFITNINHKLFKKVFGTLVYEKEMSVYKQNYNLYDFKTTIRKSEISE